MDKKNKNIAIFGANGTIGSAMLAHYQNESQVYAFSRSDFDASDSRCQWCTIPHVFIFILTTNVYLISFMIFILFLICIIFFSIAKIIDEFIAKIIPSYRMRL